MVIGIKFERYLCVILFIFSLAINAAFGNQKSYYIQNDQLSTIVNDKMISTSIPTLDKPNPAFLEYFQIHHASRLTNNFRNLNSSIYMLPSPLAPILMLPSYNDNVFGHIPSPLNIRSGGEIVVPGIHTAASLPSTYDLRLLGRVTPVKNQGSSGSCWAFAAISSLESCLMSSSTWDFSENNLKNLSGYDVGWNNGGNRDMSAAYLTRWSGPVNELDDPYNPYSGVSPTGLPIQKHIQNILYIPDRTGYTDNDNIKTALMNYGAVDVSMFMDTGSASMNYSTYSYYYSGNAITNHEVTIVGWDDNYPVSKFLSSHQPPGNGAWIVKNSWGTGWGNAGYFYVSYYDNRFPLEATCFYNAESLTNYSDNYQYDPLGCTSSLSWSNDNVSSFANVFTASRAEQLAAVSFYVLAPITTYTISIYKDPTTGPIRSGQPFLTQTGSCPMGYVTIPLSSTISLEQGQKFSIVIRLTGTVKNKNVPIAIEYPFQNYSNSATANPGESYISPNKTTWYDATTYYPNTNICIKAFTVYNSTLSGTVNLSDFNTSQIPSVPVTFEFRKSDGSSFIKTTYLSADGSFQINDIESGIYDVAVKASHWLREIAPAIDLSSNYNDFNLTLINGDCNNDNMVDEGDFGLLSAAWYLSLGDVNYDVRADLNGDDGIDEGDFGILSNSWYLSGPH